MSISSSITLFAMRPTINPVISEKSIKYGVRMKTLLSLISMRYAKYNCVKMCDSAPHTETPIGEMNLLKIFLKKYIVWSEANPPNNDKKKLGVSSEPVKKLPIITRRRRTFNANEYE